MVDSERWHYKIATEWDSTPVDNDPIRITFTPAQDGVNMHVKSPYWNDPPDCPGEYGKPYFYLHKFEVVEAFFLNDKDQYFEVQVAPHGQHNAITLNGCLKHVKQELPLKYDAEIEGAKWEGTVFLPRAYFPPNVTKFNAFAMHGSGGERKFQALYPQPTGKHDTVEFHRLEYFKPIDFKSLLPANEGDTTSELWKFL